MHTSTTMSFYPGTVQQQEEILSFGATPASVCGYLLQLPTTHLHFDPGCVVSDHAGDSPTPSAGGSSTTSDGAGPARAALTKSFHPALVKSPVPNPCSIHTATWNSGRENSLPTAHDLARHYRCTTWGNITGAMSGSNPIL